ncbi:chloride intracellular channel exl-1-like [Paramacrobiotus metropolitanus]|uniref:chloride intracellular channel exl-1-like n=1 Tax=Paramacrobiotus metropolitanus TaxID=2943436 RepID=UPI002446487A|nr:chloride intracellular channel exl-1-like [Paramacrobiotus metropolitanus]
MVPLLPVCHISSLKFCFPQEYFRTVMDSENPQIASVKLFVKAGMGDGSSYGACPLSQRLHMILSLKAKSGELNYSVYAISLAKPTEEFKSLGLRHVPAISIPQCDVHLDNMDEILEYIDRTFYKVDLSFDNVLAERACKDLFSKFCFFIKSVSKDAFGLTAELEKLNAYLTQRGSQKGPFLCGKDMTYLDCELLPKLQQIRVAGREIKGYEIPEKFEGVWNYLKAAYATDVFRDSCPSDEEIILHWMDKTEIGLTVSKPQKRRSALINVNEKTHSFNVPSENLPQEKYEIKEVGKNIQETLNVPDTPKENNNVVHL